MADYNLGRAHGSVVIDYDGSEVRKAKDDIDDIGSKSEQTSSKVETANKEMQSVYNALALAVKKLSDEVDRYTAAETVSKSKVTAAEEQLRSVRESSESTAKQIKEAERALQQAQTRSAETTRRAAIATEALRISRAKLNAIPLKPMIHPSSQNDAAILDRIRQHMANVDRQTKASAGGLNLFTNRLKLMAGAAAVAVPGVAGLGVSLAALTGAAGVAVGALAAVVAAAATLAVGTAGISDVFKAAAADSKAAGGAAASSASQQRSAARAIAAAKRSLVDAEENLQRVREEAARSAIQAERAILAAQRDLLDAQQDAVRAQENLTRARAEATRQLEDMRLALLGGALDERQALLNVQEAQEELNKVLKDPTSTQREKDQAILNLEKEKLALEEAQLAQTRLQEDTEKANAAGVQGSAEVISAQDAVAASMRAVSDAQQSVTDAVEAAKQQQLDSSRAINDAIDGVADAQRSLSEAYEDAAVSAAGGASKTADAMANISPNARAVVRAILEQKDAWQQLKFSVQDRLFADFADDVAPLANTFLPLLKEGLGGIADGFNDIIEDVVRFLQTQEAIDNFRQIFSNTGLAVGNLRTVVKDLLAAFLDIAAVGSDFLPGMATNASNAAAGFRSMISEARQTGQLRQWMQDGIDAVSQLWQLLKNVASIIGTVFEGLDQAGGGALNTLTKLTGQIDEFLKSAEGQEALQALGKVLAAIGGAYGKVFMSFLEVAADLLVALQPLIVAFADAAGTYLAGALQGLGAVLQPIADILGFLGPALGPVIAGIYAANKAVDAAKILWRGLNVVMSANPFLVIAAAIITLVILIIQNWDQISQFLSDVWNGIKEVAETVWTSIRDFFVNIWNEVRDFFVNIWTVITNYLQQRWDDIKSAVVNTWNRIRDVFTNTGDAIVTKVRDFVSKVVTFFRELPGKIWDFIKSLPEKFVNLGRDIVSGILRGLGNLASAIWNKLKSAISSAWDGLLDFFGISSPSKLAAEAGQNIALGLARGIEGSAGAVAKAALTLADAAAVAIPGMDPNTPSGLALNATRQATAPVGLVLPAVTSAARGAQESGRTTSIYVDSVNNYVTGNLDPTDPVRWRRAMVGIRDGVKSVERDYA